MARGLAQAAPAARQQVAPRARLVEPALDGESPQGRLKRPPPRLVLRLARPEPVAERRRPGVARAVAVEAAQTCKACR